MPTLNKALLAQRIGLLAAILFGGFSAEAPAAPPETVKIGVIAPLTGSNASRGEEITRTINIFKSLLTGRPTRYQYDFLVDDGKCGLGNSATTITEKFINLDGVKFMLSGCSGETIQAGLIAEKAKVLLIGVLASDPAVRGLGPYVYRTYVDIGRGVAAIAKQIRADGRSRVAVLSEDLAFTLTIKKLLLEALGDKVVYSDEFPTESNDFATLLSRAKLAGPDAWYFNCASPKTMTGLVNKAKALQMNEPIYSYFVAGEKSFLEATGANSEGIKFIDAPDIKDSSQEFKNFMLEYQKQYPDGPIVEFLTRTTFDALKSMVAGIEAAGANPAAVKDFLNSYKFQGALGEVAYDQNGDVMNLNFVLKQIVKGRPVSLN